MKRFYIAIAVLFLSSCSMPAFAQDAESNNPKHQAEMTEIHQAFSTTIKQLQKWSDTAKRELLKTTSNRNLQFRCGRYWVDVYSKLIAPNDHEVGIWGVDLPLQGQSPEILKRR